MDNYTCKQFGSFKILIKNSLLPACSDEQWKDLCHRFFSDKNRDEIQKEGEYKTIFKTTINKMPCIIKKYRNNGFIRKTKSPFFPSKAMNEFHAAVNIHNRGIPTASPLFIAEEKKWGFVSQSLVALPFLSGTKELKDIFFNMKCFSFPAKRKILESFGSLTGKIFQQGIFQYDYSLNNFLIRKEQEKHQIYFIDFERVKIKTAIPESEKLFLLAKLNRIGRELSLAERMRFLRAYLKADSKPVQNVKALAKKLQKKTAEILKKDLKRGRLTSIYTHGNYERIKIGQYNGLCKKGYDAEDIIRQAKNIPDGPYPANISLKFEESETVLKAVQFKKHDAEKVWSIISTLIIAGLPMELPHVLVQNDCRGFIIAGPQTFEKLRLLTCSQTPVLQFITDNFSDAFEKLKVFIKNM